jgi:hypothetical protein
MSCIPMTAAFRGLSSLSTGSDNMARQNKAMSHRVRVNGFRPVDLRPVKS